MISSDTLPTFHWEKGRGKVQPLPAPETEDTMNFTTILDYDHKRQRDTRWFAMILNRHVSSKHTRSVGRVFDRLREEFYNRYGRNPAGIMALSETEKGWIKVVIAGPLRPNELGDEPENKPGERLGDNKDV